MNISLINRKALVGGSTSGIGKAIAIELAKSGASVTLMARNEEKLKTTLSELAIVNDFQKHQLLVIDFNNHVDFKQKIDSYFEHNSVDILVNNTQGPAGGNIQQKDLNDYQEAFNLLFQNNSYVSLKALQVMKLNQYGRIINVSSLTVKTPATNLILSNTMRTAFMSWTKSLAEDVAEFGITVNNILTGLFDTERIVQLSKLDAEKRNITVEEVLQEKIKEIPMKRLGKPEEYGYLVTFLASEYAAYLTGTNIPLDGGVYKGF